MADTWPIEDTITTGTTRSSPRSELEAALSSDVRKKLIFPHELDEIDHWAAFRIHTHSFRRDTDFPVRTNKGSIFLPMPANLGTQYTQDYSSVGLGPAGEAGATLGKGIISGGTKESIIQSLETVRDAAPSAVSWYALQAAEEGLGAVIGSFFGVGGAVAGAAAGQALKGAIAGAGIARNPYETVMYSSPSFREHSFSWKFIPKNLEESNTLRELILKFKYHSAPSIHSSNKHFFEYPEQFDIDFHYPDYLYNIGPSVLKNFEVNYHAEGQPLYHDINQVAEELGFFERNKTPVSIQISATFQEIGIVTKQTIQSQNR